MDDPPYEVLKQRLICENRYLSVSLDTIGKDGKILVEDYMSIGHTTYGSDQITGTLTLPVDNEKYGLLKIYRHPIRKYSWEIPGGFIEQNETPISCSKRELEEETGLVCETKDLVELGTFHPAPGLVSGKVCLFSAEKCRQISKTVKPEFEISQFKWFSEEETEEFIGKGLIHDISTILAIYRRKILLSKVP